MPGGCPFLLGNERMTNGQIAGTLDLIADLLEVTGANAFRVRAYRNGARAIQDMTESIADLVSEGTARLMEIDGVGKAVAEKCVTLVQTGELPQLNELLEKTPKSVLALLRIPNLGPKKVAALYKELNIVDLDQLKAACDEGRVRELKGFGLKTEEIILKGLAIAEAANRRIYWEAADEIAQALSEHLRACPSIKQLELAGSYRRRRDTVGDLDVLVVSGDHNDVMNRLGDFSGVTDVLVRGDTKMSVRLDTGLQIDLRVVPEASFGAALQYFTGSKEHNVAIRAMAKARGLKVNEWGVFQVDGEKEDQLAGATEAGVYGSLGLPIIAPELREGRREIEWAESDALPDLIELSDIRGDLHMHTTASDGRHDMAQMVKAARDLGLSYIAITDHSQRVAMARGLNPERLLAQWAEIEAFNATLDDGFLVLKGIECDILEAGGMDLPDDVLAQADWVLASVHYGQRQPREQITERILGAIENPYVSAIAHPTGRLLNQREPYALDMEAVMQSAKTHGKILELNASPQRLDLHDQHLAAAKSLGIPVVINTDAHSIDGLANMRFGILQARRGGLEKCDVVNTRSLEDLRSLLC
jgi:DNA polymerase (family 10)